MSTPAELEPRETGDHHVTPVGTIFSLLIIIGLIVSGIAGAWYFIKSKPEVKRKKPAVSAPLVRIMEAAPGSHTVVVEALGVVKGSQTVSLRPQAAGKIISISPHLDPGGVFSQEASLLKIDPSDYELALTQQKAILSQAVSALAVEKGKYTVAGKDVELIGSELTPEEEELAKREPQYRAAKAAVESAKAGLKKAELNLKRTDITAPFQCVVEKRYVSMGDIVSSSTVLADLTGTDEFRIEATLPVDQLRWISIPENGSKPGSDVRIEYPAAWGEGVYRTGKIHSLSPSLTDTGRMAVVFVSVKDPLNLKKKETALPAMNIGAMVRLYITGTDIDSIIAVPRSAVHDGNTVWVADGDDILDIRTIETVWVSRTTAFISKGISKGERIIVSDLAAPIMGMKVHPVTETGEELNGLKNSTVKSGETPAGSEAGTEKSNTERKE